jgi:hypothetical protein
MLHKSRAQGSCLHSTCPYQVLAVSTGRECSVGQASDRVFRLDWQGFLTGPTSATMEYPTHVPGRVHTSWVPSLLRLLSSIPGRPRTRRHEPSSTGERLQAFRLPHKKGNALTISNADPKQTHKHTTQQQLPACPYVRAPSQHSRLG